MKTIFDKDVRSNLIERINALQASQTGHWGKMNVFEMLKHCNLSEEMFLGKKQYNRLFIGRLFGKMVLKGITKNEAQMKQNQPTHPEFKIKGSGDLEMEKKKWVMQLKEYETYTTTTFIHPFFGQMSREEIGIYVFKHTDHHLRQFNQ